VEDLPAVEDGAWHVVAEGETLWDIARGYELSVDAILTRNELDDEAARRIHPGQPLIIPGVRASQIHHAEASEHTARGFRHTVAHGETIWDLARSFHVSVAELMAANRLSPETAQALREGERLYIPGARRGADRASKRPPRLNARQRRARALARRLGLGTSRAAHRLLGGRVEARWVRAAGGRRGRFPGTLRWPVTHGRYVRGYGSGDGGYHLAMDIAGSIGWNVRASAPGIVGYAGDGIRGYGNVVLLIHPGGWVTMYAHNSMIYVVAGERVPAGAVLAELGSTGISRGPHVHFEFMYDGKNCDPAGLFRPGVRHAHRLARIPRETWTRPNNRPADLRCHRRIRFPHSSLVEQEVVPSEGASAP
jgi:murein DD-endopeptidase MepM/ murein hydrolase activator NlpD